MQHLGEWTDFDEAKPGSGDGVWHNMNDNAAISTRTISSTAGAHGELVESVVEAARADHEHISQLLRFMRAELGQTPKVPDHLEELSLGVVYNGVAEWNQFLYYKIHIPTSDQEIIICANPQDDESDPDVYVSNETMGVAQDNYIWKSSNVGPVELCIHPEDRNFKSGWYYIGVLGFKENTNRFSIKVSTRIPKPILPLELRHPVVCTLTQDQPAYFRTHLHETRNGQVSIQLRCDNKDVIMYISNLHRYPSLKGHVWSMSFTHAEKERECDWVDLNYRTNSLHRPHSTQDCITQPTVTNRCDSDISEAVPFNGYLLETTIDGDEWRYLPDPNCYIGIHSAAPCQIELEVAHILDEQVLTPTEKRLYNVFRSLTGAVDGNALSSNERTAKQLLDRVEFTYGEVEFVPFLKMMQTVRIPKNGVFWDLGCGVGKAVFAMALSHPDLQVCHGIELLDTLYRTAQEAADCYNDQVRGELLKEGIASAPVHIHQADILQEDWSGADILYISSICFSDELLQAIATKTERLKSGSCVVTLKDLRALTGSLRLIENFRVKMSWGKSSCYVFERK
eukprot:GILK01011596.1.p1 GENE.GILK01011596.1~~GILK01011596.1.p1  ORF type:complete len:567 (-),score=61.01 GILK01011596.1:368-2068(-)